jgi:hypothetical protein
LKDDEYKEEEDTIHDILSNNGFPVHIGKETTFITNLFKKTDLKVAWRTTNTIQELLMPQHQPPDKYAAPECTS